MKMRGLKKRKNLNTIRNIKDDSDTIYIILKRESNIKILNFRSRLFNIFTLEIVFLKEKKNYKKNKITIFFKNGFE